MGYYLNPESGTKERFLKENATRISQPNTLPASKDKCFICLVNNGNFSAAGVIFSQKELSDWTQPSDDRNKTWYEIDKTKAESVSNQTIRWDY